MKLTLTNQRPSALNPVHTIPIAGPYEPFDALRKTVVDPIFEPLTAGTPVSLTDPSGSTVNADEVMALVTATLDETVNTKAEDTVKPLLAQATLSYDASTPLLTNAAFAVQAAGSLKPALPHPNPTTIYNGAADVVPAAKRLLAGNGSEAEFFASLAYAYSPETLGFWFLNEAAFEDAKTWILTQAQNLGPALPTQTTSLMTSLSNLKLAGLTEALVLRADTNDNNDEYSFARVLVYLLMKYQAQAANTAQAAGATMSPVGVLPFHMGELFVPRTVVFVNVESHARASGRKVDNEWKLINASLASPVKVVTRSALGKLTAAHRAAAKAAAAAAAATASSNRIQQTGRSAAIKFRKRPPTKVDLYKHVLKALIKMKKVNFSQNVFKRSHTTFMKASRRDPDDYNRPGRTVSNVYLPDVHIYLDCSGSISEQDYQDAVQMLIALAKKMNVNLYFSSFSHVLSQEILLKTAGKSVDAIWNEFRHIPKVSGGTDYLQIWQYIQANKQRRERFSLVLTDFEWWPPTSSYEHPRNLYYAPIVSSNWNSIVRYAKSFSQGMRHIEPAIAQRLLGVIV